jgi:protein disulfide-isomerase-like protein
MYAPWCGHCKRLAPTWAELAAGFAGSDSIGIASVDCTQHKTVCDAAGVKGYPTLKVFHGGEAKEEYHGGRTLEALQEYVVGQKRTLLDLTVQ